MERVEERWQWPSSSEKEGIHWKQWISLSHSPFREEERRSERGGREGGKVQRLDGSYCPFNLAGDLVAIKNGDKQ
uniref:Uncharacterized protein n=1 Tax=Oryza brachyantha TaxID=4533 RepID=A0A1V1H5V5_ORYBR|nr:hypothetical protein [Oryza brachyantha]